ncbi:hypothetical protein [Spirosoma fluminis]
MTNAVGKSLSPCLTQPVEQPALTVDEVVYASMDGSMILTDTGWQEVKLGRVFTSQNRVATGSQADQQPRFKLTKSTYSGHLGSFHDFIPKFEASLGVYKTQPERLVFVTDGTLWIQRYIEKTYPTATHILDYYHALEHLSTYARLHFAHPWRREQWLGKQADYLLSNDLDDVLRNLAELKKLSPGATAERTKLVAYYQQNRHRMQYGRFRDRGLLIGSGPMCIFRLKVVQRQIR